MSERDEIIGAVLSHARNAVALWHSDEDSTAVNVQFAYSMSRLSDELRRLDRIESNA